MIISCKLYLVICPGNCDLSFLFIINYIFIHCAAFLTRGHCMLHYDLLNIVLLSLNMNKECH